MTIDERIGRTVNRLAVVERLLELEVTEGADDCDHEDAVRAGIWEMIRASYEDLEPIGHAPDAIANWVPDPDDPVGPHTVPPTSS